MIGTTIAHYRITAKLGEGGMGVVYKAEDTRLERTVALKFLSSTTLSDTESLRFTHEAQAAARIHHPNICPIYEISEHEGRLFFAMAFIEGRSIARLLDHGPLDPSTALDLAIQVANGLEAAHRQGIVHRDIKSGNIVMDRTGNASILDFGIALRQDVTRMTIPGGTVGTPAYMSPEQAQGKTVDARTDLWSLGVLLFEMLTGQLPFRRESQLSVLYAIVNDEPQLAAPKEYEAFLNKALAKDPDERWQSAAEMATALRRIREGHSDRTVTMTSLRAVPGAKGSRRKLLTGAIALLVLVLIGLAIWLRPFGEEVPEMKQIAVLPLEIIGDQKDETMRALADGLVETLTAKLSQVEDFQGKVMVVPASEVRSQKITSAQAARRLYGTNLAITGSAQRWGNGIQFTLSLVDTATVRIIGSRTFDYDAERPTAMRDRTVDGVVRLLAIQLTPVTSAALLAGETSTPGAYAEYLKGAGYLARYDLAGNIDRAIESLVNATTQDPEYALAWAALGDAYWKKATNTKGDKEIATMALESIRRAIKLDSRLDMAHIRLGAIYGETGRTQEAIQEVQKAGGNAEAYRVLADIYNRAGRFDEAEKAYLKAIEKQPANWYNQASLGVFYRERGRFADARTAFDNALRLTPDNELVNRSLAALSMREGKFREASEFLARTLTFEPSARTYSTLGMAYYHQGRFQEAVSALDSGLNLDPGIYTLWGNIGAVYHHIPGAEKQSRVALQKAVNLAEEILKVTPADFRTRANLAEYRARLGDRERALEEIGKIPDAVRGPFTDQIVLALQLSGETPRAQGLLRSLKPDDPTLIYMKSDPDIPASVFGGRDNVAR